jgi:glucose/arabinose dehydrogenase
MNNLAKTALLLTVCATAALTAGALAQPNMGNQRAEASLPFNVAKVATFNLPWRIAFLPDGRMIVTEKVGPVWLVTPAGVKTPIANVPAVQYGGQGGMLGVYTSPNYARDNFIYLTYSEPGSEAGTSSLALARARLQLSGGNASLEGLQVIWRDPIKGRGGQFGAAVAFRDNLLYLAVGDRQRMTPAQDPNQPLGKILRLTLDGKPAPGNPQAGKTGAQSIDVINPPRDTELAKTAPVVNTQKFPGPNLTPSETWATGFRTPYGLAFAPNGQLWEIEHGPRGGDELNLVEPGKNYGWPIVSFGINYNGTAIANYDPAKCDGLPAAGQAICRAPGLDRSPYTRPVIYWVPVIAPGNLMFYRGSLFRGWAGSALASGLSSESITRITFDGKGGATAVQRWDMGFQVRDVEEAPDGSLWAVENSSSGGLYRLTPK